jgi:hypothetical protein
MGGLKEGRRTRRTRSCAGGLRSKLRSAADVVRYMGAWEFASRVLPWSLARDYSIFSQDLDKIVPVASWNEVPMKNMIRSGMTEIARLRCRNVPGFVKARWSGRVDVREDGSFALHGAP